MPTTTSGLEFFPPTKGMARGSMTIMEDFLCSKQQEHLAEQLNIGCLCFLNKDVTKEELKQRLLSTLMQFDRLRCRIVQDERGRFFYEDHGDAEQVIDSMIVEREVQPGEDENLLQPLRDSISLNAWPPNKPHWDVHILRGIPKKEETKNCSIALFFRIDHVLGDGHALLHALLSVCQVGPGKVLRFPSRASEADDGNDSKPKPALVRITSSLLSVLTAVLYQSVMLFPALCYALSTRVLEDTSSCFKLKGALPQLVVKKNVGLTRACDLAVVKSLGRAHGCTVNDMLIAWVSGGLRRYLLNKGDPSVHADQDTNARQRAVFAYSQRAFNKQAALDFANRIVFVPVPLPASVPDLAGRIKRVKDATSFVKSTLVAFLTKLLLDSVGNIPSIGRKAMGNEINEGLKRITSSFSALAGPIEKVSICGATVEYMAVSANPAGLAMSFTAFSYAGMVTLSATTHPALVEGGAMMRSLTEEWDAFQRAVTA